MNSAKVSLDERSVKKFSELMKKGDYRDVIKEATSAYLKLDKDDAMSTVPLAFIQTAIERVFEKDTDTKIKSMSPNPVCSFCGQSPLKVRLGAGPDVFICNECVETFHDIFERSS